MKRLLTPLATACLLAGASSAHAAAYSGMVVFGERVGPNVVIAAGASVGDGTVLGRYGSTTKPEKIAGDVEAALAG